MPRSMVGLLAAAATAMSALCALTHGYFIWVTIADATAAAGLAAYLALPSSKEGGTQHASHIKKTPSKLLCCIAACNKVQTSCGRS
jgi:hypothetical protein